MALTSRISAAINGLLTGSPDLASTQANVKLEKSNSFLNGALAGQANVIWQDSGSIAASSTTDLDLAGALTDALGGAAVFARVKGLIISAAAANTNNVIVGAATSNPWTAALGSTHTITLRPGAWVALAAGTADLTGYAVVAGSGDTLRLANSGAGSAVLYDIAILGCAT
jgi:hypothetical protein